MTGIHITDIESAINFWRTKTPSLESAALPEAAWQAWLTWYESTPDTPCIAICSTSQGDEVCKGCGRTFAEVQYWTEMQPVQKRATWRRITQEGTAWRFNKYAERATGQGVPPGV